MNKYLCLIICLCFCLNKIQAQKYPTIVEYDLLKLGVITASNYGTGLLASSEMRYNYSQKFSFGMKSDLVFLGNRTDLPSQGQDGLNSDCIVSFTFLGDYKFSKKSNTAFAGLGFGYFKGIGDNFNPSGIGSVLRLGYIFHHIRLVAEFNIAPSSDIPNVLGITLGYPIRFG